MQYWGMTLKTQLEFYKECMRSLLAHKFLQVLEANLSSNIITPKEPKESNISLIFIFN